MSVDAVEKRFSLLKIPSKFAAKRLNNFSRIKLQGSQRAILKSGDPESATFPASGILNGQYVWSPLYRMHRAGNLQKFSQQVRRKNLTPRQGHFMHTWKTMLRYCLFAMLFGIGGTSSALEPLAKTIEKIELVSAATPQVKMPFEWSIETKDLIAAHLDVGLGSEFSDYFTAFARPSILSLNVTPKQKDLQIQVRQRSVSYLNVSGQGPHIAIGGTDVASRWVTLQPKGSTIFPVIDHVPQKLRMTRKQIVAAVKKTDPEWVELAKDCTSADGGACYSITDTEFEISVTQGGVILSKGVVRVSYPNGC